MALTKIRQMNKSWKHEQKRRKRREALKQTNLRWEHDQKRQAAERRKQVEDAKAKREKAEAV